MRRAFHMDIQRELANRQPQLWNVVRSQYVGHGEYLDKVIRRHLTERQAISLIRRLTCRTGEVLYGGEAVGRESHKLLA